MQLSLLTTQQHCDSYCIKWPTVHDYFSRWAINEEHTCVISALLHSVNLILFTVLLVHLILRISPHHSHHLRSHHLGYHSLGLSLQTLNSTISFTNP